MLVWSGYSVWLDGPCCDDGAAYNPATNTWRALPAAPVSGRFRFGSVWTGTELVVWGGNDGTKRVADGAAYNPTADTWRTLAKAPLAPRSNLQAVWTGGKVLFWGGEDDIIFGNGAAYDPAADAWAPLATTRTKGKADASAVWSGSEMVVWGGRAVSESASFDLVNTGARFAP